MNKKERIEVPNYYIGSVYGYEARKVIEDWNLSYKFELEWLQNTQTG